MPLALLSLALGAAAQEVPLPLAPPPGHALPAPPPPLAARLPLLDQLPSLPSLELLLALQPELASLLSPPSSRADDDWSDLDLLITPQSG